MSFQDDFKDLESRLRHNKPETEPLSPALKGQMRQALMEQMTMNENPFTLRKLSMALGGLVLLVGVPLFFWMIQMSASNTLTPGNEGPTAVPTQSTILDPARPTVATTGDEVEVPVVEIDTDKVWIISADILQGETTSRYETINAVFGYELHTVEEANLIVKLVDGPRGVLTVEQPVSGADGTVEVALPLSQLEEVSGDSVTLELNIILEDPNNTSERLLYLDFVEGWTIDLAVDPVITAEITSISKPSLIELGGPATQPVYQVELLTTYTYEVTGLDNAVLVVGYQYQDPNNGTTAGYEVTAIEPGRGEIPVVIALGAGFIDAKGEVMDGVEFFIRINSYDEAVGEWLNLFPGNEPLTVGEQNLANPSAVLTTQTEQTSGQNDVWIISTNVITQTTANGVKADITLVVGYQLSSDYTSGLIRFGSSYESQNSGGGGGSSTPVTPGSGTTEFVFDFETTSWATAKEWLASMSSHLELLGNTVDGAEVLVGETFKIGTD